MAHANRDLLVRVILPVLTFGGIALQLGAAQFIKKLVRFRHLAEDAKEDYFSQLPDDILCSILSRLSVRDAARTSLLSRRWNYLFRTLTVLDFNCLDMFGIHPYKHLSCPSYQQKFLKGVNQVLQLYSGRKVDVVRIKFCKGRGFSSEFNQWIQSISRVDIKGLSLYFDCGTDGPLPSSNPIRDPSKMLILRFEFPSSEYSLKHLSLYHCIIKPSSRVGPNSLKTLNLLGVLLGSGHLESILSSCLSLSLLRLERCALPSKLRISGTVASIYLLWCGGLEEIDLQATNLRVFVCKFYSKVLFYFSSVPMLEHVMIQMGGDASIPYIFGDFARDLPAQVKSLIVTADSQIRYFPKEKQMFGNLMQLTLVLVSTYDFDIVNISPVLSACPLLQYLHLEHVSTMRESGRTWSSLSPTYHTELKQLTFSGFLGGGAETEFVLFILRSATVLERVFLSPVFECYSGGHEWKTMCKASFDDRELPEALRRTPGGDERKNVRNSSIDERKQKWIRGQLSGQAISPNAVVVIHL